MGNVDADVKPLPLGSALDSSYSPLLSYRDEEEILSSLHIHTYLYEYFHLICSEMFPLPSSQGREGFFTYTPSYAVLGFLDRE